MTSIAAELLSAGLVHEVEDTAEPGGRGGRRARLLVLEADRVVSAGISITDSHAQWAVLSLLGEPLASGRISRMGHREPAEWIGLAMAEANGAMHEWLAGRDQVPVVAGVGVGLPGIVDPGTLRTSIVLETDGVDLRSAWESIPTPVCTYCQFDNDANCCAWSIAFTGGSHETVVFAHALLHNNCAGVRPSMAGLGLALVFRGAVHYGATNTAGEIRGYRWNERSADQLGVPPSTDPGQVRERLLSEILANLGVVASVIDPDRVVLGGDLSQFAPQVHAMVAPDHVSGPAALLADRLIVAAPGEHTVEIGAARMILHDLFAVPTLDAPQNPDLSWPVLLGRLESAVQRGGARRTLPA